MKTPPLHHALVEAGKGSPLTADQVVRLGAAKGGNLTAAEAVALARSTLLRHSRREPGNTL